MEKCIVISIFENASPENVIFYKNICSNKLNNGILFNYVDTLQLRYSMNV